jgi:AraC family transcriptional regulator
MKDSVDSASGVTKPIHADDALVAESSARAWPGFRLEHRIVPSGESPRLVLAQPITGLVMNEEPVVWNWKANGRDYDTEFHFGSVSVFPVGDIPAQYWKQPLRCLDVFFEPRFVARVAEDSLNGREPEFRFEPNAADTTVEMLIRALYAELRDGCQNGALFGESLGTALAIALIQRFGTQQAAVLTCTKALNARVLKRVIDYIQSHLDEDLSLEAIADVAHISSYYFGKLFKISMGQTVHQYVMSERLKRARWLLKNRTLPQEEIALACGFSSQSHFATAFRNETGLTPRRFRLLDSY